MNDNNPDIKKAAIIAYAVMAIIIVLLVANLMKDGLMTVLLAILLALVGVFIFQNNANSSVKTEKAKSAKLDNEIKNIKDDDTREIIANARKINSNILGMINKVEDDGLKQNIREIYRISNKIISAVVKEPKKMKRVQTFFDYYMPETYKILQKYDEIENQRLGDASKQFMEKTRTMIAKIKDTFNEVLTSLYQDDMVDVDAQMKVFDSVIKSEGFGKSDFKM